MVSNAEMIEELKAIGDQEEGRTASSLAIDIKLKNIL